MTNYKQTIKLEDGKEVLLRKAAQGDMDEIKHLYYVVYGGKFTLPEINDSDKMKWVINDPNYFWLIGEHNGEIISSVIAVTDQKHKIGKTFAGVVHPSFRRNKLLKKKLEIIHEALFEKEKNCEVIYAVARTFAPLSFHEDLKELGYIDLGIFPNVRKIHGYETHGLKACYKPEALLNRKRRPRLIKTAYDVYEITRKKFGFEEALVDEETLNEPGEKKLTIDKLYIERSPEVEWEYYEKRDAEKLTYDFLPFHYPGLKLYTKDKKTEVYVYFLEVDGHASVLGINTDQDITLLLNFVCEYLESMGAKYLEILASAYDAKMQKKLFAANFLPCAYFPAASINKDKKRYDHVVFCKSFVPLNFDGINFFEDAKPYADVFYENYNDKLGKI